MKVQASVPPDAERQLRAKCCSHRVAPVTLLAACGIVLGAMLADRHRGWLPAICASRTPDASEAGLAASRCRFGRDRQPVAVGGRGGAPATSQPYPHPDAPKPDDIARDIVDAAPERNSRTALRPRRRSPHRADRRRWRPDQPHRRLAGRRHQCRDAAITSSRCKAIRASNRRSARRSRSNADRAAVIPVAHKLRATGGGSPGWPSRSSRQRFRGPLSVVPLGDDGVIAWCAATAWCWRSIRGTRCGRQSCVGSTVLAALADGVQGIIEEARDRRRASGASTRYNRSPTIRWRSCQPPRRHAADRWSPRLRCLARLR